jgi:hypothetical protein
VARSLLRPHGRATRRRTVTPGKGRILHSTGLAECSVALRHRESCCRCDPDCEYREVRVAGSTSYSLEASNSLWEVS